jgi:hypothetical protein
VETTCLSFERVVRQNNIYLYSQDDLGLLFCPEDGGSILLRIAGSLVYIVCFLRDLSETAITRLPTGGLENLDILRIQDTKSLKVIPSVYSFKVSNGCWMSC